MYLVYRGVVAIDVALRTIDINQCDGGGITDVFSGTHKCKDSTEVTLHSRDPVIL